MNTLDIVGSDRGFFEREIVGDDARLRELVGAERSLVIGDAGSTGTVPLKNDPRVLPVGRLLRKTKINELPQLLNILKGEMSVIGPRPQTQRCFGAFPAVSQTAIIQVRPGLSGIGSIIFRAKEEIMHASGDSDRFYDHVMMPYQGQFEEWYGRNQRLQTYVLLIVLTIWVVLNSRSRMVWCVFANQPTPLVELARDVNCSVGPHAA